MKTDKNTQLIQKHGGYDMVAKVLAEAIQGGVCEKTLTELDKAAGIADSTPAKPRMEICGQISYQQMEALVCREPKGHPAGACKPDW